MIADATWWIAAASVLQGICTFVLAVLTGFYVWYTRSLAKGASEQGQETARAFKDHLTEMKRRMLPSALGMGLRKRWALR